MADVLKLIQERYKGRLFLTTQEAQQIFLSSPRTIRTWIDAGKLKAYKPARKHLITIASVETLLIQSEII